MNRAIKYFREHGLEKSKKHLLDIREAANQVSWVHSLEGFSQDLKRLVESYELVKSRGGLDAAKHELILLQKHLNNTFGYVAIITSEKIENLKQAIADVEAYKEVL